MLIDFKNIDGILKYPASLFLSLSKAAEFPSSREVFMIIQKFYVSSPNGDRLASRHEFIMLHPGRDLKPGDFIELQEGIFQLNEELVPTSPVELGDYPTPDPAWDYAALWDWLHQMEAYLKSLKEQMADIETATSQTDATLRQQFEVVQAICLRAIESLGSQG